MNIMNVNTVIVIVIVVMMLKHTSILPLIDTETVCSVHCLKLFLFSHELIYARFPGVSHHLLYLSSIY